ncbi:putative non-LTR retroelement reverse transcriptase related protein, partial [Trifolium medium]|nr:putative non-LTR retroelement reverse transcriptase related protein [Trifolium medium]
WNIICSCKKNGGLGVKRLREFNTALLDKWCWRMLVDKGGLWFRVLAARYGVERGCLRAGGRSGSSWWREIVRIYDGVDGLGDGWFGECVLKNVGMGRRHSFGLILG